MIQLFLNGKPVTLSQSMSLDLALQEWKKNNIGIIPETFAISINEQIISQNTSIQQQLCKQMNALIC